MTAETNPAPEAIAPDPTELEPTPIEPAERTESIAVPAEGKRKVARKPKKPVPPDFARPVGPALIWLIVGFLAYPVFGLRATLLIIAFAAAALVSGLTVFIWDTGIYRRKYRRYERRLANWNKRNARNEV
ncbi:hypothetical protein [Curtobacterium sp. ISL-83]|uniref:hypothetical protein n=1 Tax=Curtobacterium sp. ISL-83 TaxID=2819145 RepID=UPI001BEA168C|nr:hypothetical protein [Curtobacterium sp. ISL-83]MBT2504191.1 hypothetical protein [Curtobacterium sp. ISL-83]